VGANAYHGTINVPAGSLAPHSDVAPLSSGVYKLAAIARYEAFPNIPTFIAGYRERPIIQMRP
jgi:hypothetical protein